MAKTLKPTQSEIDGVQYRRAKLWQIILQACTALIGMSVYSLIGLASYSGNIGYGIATVTVGTIIAFSRILDGITDPLLAFVYDRVNTHFGKLRVLMIAGLVIESVGLLCMFNFLSSKGFGIVVFSLCYVVYIIGYTITNMTAQTLPAIMTNDPKQRPTIGVWTTAMNYLVPMVMTIVLNMVLLPKFGDRIPGVDGSADSFNYNQAFLSAAVWATVIVAAIGTALVCIGISAFDKPEYFEGTTKTKEHLKLKDMLNVLAHNRPLQCYIASNASDKIAQQTMTQAVISTLINGILIGNLQIATMLTVISMIPSIFFAAFGAKYVGKHGSKKGIVTWTWISMCISIVTFVFFVVIDPKQIGVMFSPAMIIYVLLTLIQNGSNMCVTTANSSFMADTIDYELDRSGKYIPAVVSGTYSLIDKLITSLSAVIATGAVALIGYVNTVPQPGDPATPGVFWVAMAVKFGMPIIGWIITIVAMKFCPLTKEEMVNVQKRIAEKKEAIKAGK